MQEDILISCDQTSAIVTILCNVLHKVCILFYSILFYFIDFPLFCAAPSLVLDHSAFACQLTLTYMAKTGSNNETMKPAHLHEYFTEINL